MPGDGNTATETSTCTLGRTTLSSSTLARVSRLITVEDFGTAGNVTSFEEYNPWLFTRSPLPHIT